MGLLRVRQLIKKYQLTKRQYRALLLRCEGLRYREIAGEMGITFQSAWELVQRGAKRVRKKTKAREGEKKFSFFSSSPIDF